MNAAQPNFGAAELAVEALRTQALILSLIKDIRTAIPVKVMAVHPGAGSPPAIGTVDVQPLVQTVDGSGKLWNLGVTYGAQAMRIQSGGTALVIDPSVGDIGLAVVNDRDISSVIAAAGLAGPGSARAHDISDLVYLFSILSAAAVTQYIWANANGISLLSLGTITINGAQINLVGPVHSQNNITAPDVLLPNGAVNPHVHGGVQSGSSNTGTMTG